ncbi:hypothetical protein BDR26DRAFT_1007739 [Obelidium mucronatum]|nr:hypothetical protein BDR26DRAFT_1007739 [Obelidium mucronatum]
MEANDTSLASVWGRIIDHYERIGLQEVKELEAIASQNDGSIQVPPPEKDGSTMAASDGKQIVEPATNPTRRYPVRSTRATLPNYTGWIQTALANAPPPIEPKPFKNRCFKDIEDLKKKWETPEGFDTSGERWAEASNAPPESSFAAHARLRPRAWRAPPQDVSGATPIVQAMYGQILSLNSYRMRMLAARTTADNTCDLLQSTPTPTVGMCASIPIANANCV